LISNNSKTKPKSKSVIPPRRSTTHSPMSKSTIQQSSRYDYYANLIKQIDEKNEPETPQEMEKENNFLRDKMKEFSVQLSKQIENIKPGQHLKRQKEEKEQSRTIDDEIHTLNRQLENSAKMLAVIEEEYRKVTAQVANAKDPSYIYEIEKQIADVQKEAITIKKENRKLKHQAKGHGKELIKKDAINEGDDKVKAVEFQLKEISVFKKKIQKLKEEADNFEEQKQLKETKLDLTELECYKLSKEMDEYPEPDEVLVQKAKELKEKLGKLENEEINRDNIRNFHRQKIEKELEELILGSIRDREHIERLERMHAEQSIVLQKLSKQVGIEVVTKTTDSSNQNNIWNRLHSHSPIASITEGLNSEGFLYKPKTVKNKELKTIIAKKAKDNIYSDLPIYNPLLLKPNNSKVRAGNQAKLKQRNESVDFAGRNSVVGGSFHPKDAFRNQTKSTNLSMVEGHNNKRILDESEIKKNIREDKELPSVKPNLFKKPFGKGADPVKAKRNSHSSLEDIPAANTNDEEKSLASIGKMKQVSREPSLGTRRESTSISPLKSGKPRTPLKLPTKIDTEDKIQPITTFAQRNPESRQRESLSLPQSKSTAVKGLPSLKDENFKPKYIPTQDTPSEGLKLPVVDINSKSTTESKMIPSNPRDQSTGDRNKNVTPVAPKQDDSQEYVFGNMDRMNRARRGGPSLGGGVSNEIGSNLVRKASKGPNRYTQDVDDLFPTNLPEVKDNVGKKNLRGARNNWEDNLGEVQLGSDVLDGKESRRDRTHLFKKESEGQGANDDLFVPRNEKKGGKLSLGREDDFSFGGLNRLTNKTPGLQGNKDIKEDDLGFEGKKIKRMRMGDEGKKKANHAQKAAEGGNDFFGDFDM